VTPYELNNQQHYLLSLSLSYWIEKFTKHELCLGKGMKSGIPY